MKKLLYRIIKIFFIILLCLICLLVALILLLTIISSGSSFDKRTAQDIRSDPMVLDVTWGRDEIRSPYFRIKLTFIDGGRINAYYMDKYGKTSKVKNRIPASIHIIDDYFIHFYNKNEKKPISRDLEAWSAVIGVEMESIVDFIKNYQIIKKHVENWADFSDYRQNDSEGFSETRNRAIALKQYSDSVMINGQKIVLFKYPTSLYWLMYYDDESYARSKEWLEKF